MAQILITEGVKMNKVNLNEKFRYTYDELRKDYVNQVPKKLWLSTFFVLVGKGVLPTNIPPERLLYAYG